MDFGLAEYLRQNGFTQTRESDKRDIFEKEYFHPFHDEMYKACVTIYYDGGYSKFNSYSIWLMTIEFLNNKKTLTIFNGIAPTTFDQASDLFELSMPTGDFLKRKDI
ncbi:MAG TPA: hypothetical protein VHZ50_19455 [Puia sp.]|jgi:hypothetical protein|nr:hypothetical protein [Puia sp.]